MPVVISDTSPVRALAHLGLLELLFDLFGLIHIPPAVKSELENPPGSLPRVDVSQVTFLEVQAPLNTGRIEYFLQSLDRGEAEALALAEEIHADAVLIDEAAGRLTAAQCGLKVVGTMGILLQAKRKRLIDSVAPLLTSLQEELGFFISSELYDEVLRRAGE